MPFVSHVALHADVSRMTASNLILMLAPNLIRIPDEDPEDIKKCIEVMQFIYDHWEEVSIWKKDPNVAFGICRGDSGVELSLDEYLQHQDVRTVNLYQQEEEVLDVIEDMLDEKLASQNQLGRFTSK
jgi:hypothetical protein